MGTTRPYFLVEVRALLFSIVLLVSAFAMRAAEQLRAAGGQPSALPATSTR